MSYVVPDNPKDRGMDKLRQSPSKASGVHAPLRGCDVGPDAAARELDRPVSLWMACPPETGQPLEWASRADEPLGGQSVPRGNREHADQLILKLREAELNVTRQGRARGCMDRGGQGGLPFSAISSQFETDKSRLVADLSGEWSRFGVLCLGLARFLRPG